MSDELHPPRYEQRGSWKHLITDEQEWLARPASWGIDHLPEPIQGGKRTLFNFHFFPRFTRWVKCEPCRPLVASLFAEDGGTLPDWVPSTREALREWYDPLHPDGRCEAWDAFRSAMHLRMNAIVAQEFSNKLVDVLFGCRHHREFETPGSRLRELSNQWDRELALELIGPNPFRPTAFDPSWRTEAVVGLARGMYECRDFGPMQVLADALEDAGWPTPTRSCTVGGRGRMSAAAGSSIWCSGRRDATPIASLHAGVLLQLAEAPGAALVPPPEP